MGAASLLPSPRYYRKREGSLERAALQSALMPKAATKRLSGALERTFTELLGADVELSKGASPKLSFGLVPKGAKPGTKVVAPERPEGYAIDVTPDGVFAAAADERGLYYAAVTVMVLLRDPGAVDACTIIDWPVCGVRGLHLDLKGFMPTFDALLATVDEAAELKLSALLVEYEDKIRYASHPDLAAPTALSKSQVRRFVKYARERYVDVVPLLQALGHAEYILKHPGYADLAEMPGRPQQLCPSKPKTVKIFKDAAEELAELHPAELFHIGSDETWQLGRCRKCSARAKEMGKDGLYLDHTSKVLKIVRKLGKRPMLWDDMLRRMADDDVKRLGIDAVLVYWRYGVPGGCTLAEKLPQLARFRALGFDVVGASATKGADGDRSNLPDFTRRMDNLDLWARAADTGELLGVIATAWSRYNSFRMQCDVPASQHFALAYSAERQWGGMRRPRADFERNYARFAFGLEHSGVALAAAHHAMNSGGRTGHAWALELSMAEARRNRERLRLVAGLGRMEDHVAWCRRLRDEVDAWMPQITGPLPLAAFAELLGNIGRLEADGKRLRVGLGKLLAKTLCDDEVEEFLESRFGPTERLSARVRELLR